MSFEISTYTKAQQVVKLYCSRGYVGFTLLLCKVVENLKRQESRACVSFCLKPTFYGLGRCVRMPRESMRLFMKNRLVKWIATPLVPIVVSLVLFSACEKPMPKASFEFHITNGSYYATCHLYNYSLESDTYEWTLHCPDGTIETSYSFETSFRCYQTGTYKITLVAKNRNGSDVASKNFTIYFNGGGGGDDNPTASAYTITWLRLEEIPMLDGNNASWDTGLFGNGNPDIKFKIQNSTNTTTYYTSPVKSDVSSSDLPVTWYNVNTTLEKGVEYRIEFIDQDEGIDDDDIMVNCVWKQLGYFSPDATSFTWISTDGTVRFTVGLSWIYSKEGNDNLTQGVLDNERTEGDNTPIHPQQPN